MYKLMASSNRYEEFQAWVLATHGDSARTKTVTLRKCLRIVRTLRGEDPACAENSKFRFWVRNKGFRDTPPHGYVCRPADKIVGRHLTPADLYVPSGDKDIGSEYKKVAIVENFFDIIEGVHVNIDGKGGKHAGQKRTYRTVTETYAFLPREAVTKFLLLCEECRMRPRGCPGLGVKAEHGGEPELPFISAVAVVEEEPSKLRHSPPIAQKPPTPPNEETAPHKSPPTLILEQVSPSPPPLSSTPHISNNSTSPSAVAADTSSSRGETSTSTASGDSSPTSLHKMATGRRRTLRKPLQVRRNPHRPPHHYPNPIWFPVPKPDTAMRRENHHLGGAIDLFIKEESSTVPEADTPDDAPFTGTKETEKLKMMLLAWNAAGGRNGEDTPEEASTAWRYQGGIDTANSGVTLPQTKNPSRSSPSQETASVHDETSSSGNKDEDDEDEDEEERIDPQKYDPERLKAFNMFVRLFVDENLDRIVPISKQPKEKIQAIIDSCARQFPEFADRARKRIRTYLKSCRRNKRTRDGGAAWEPQSRPTPAHLTSVQAEQILAQACENESHNAKRMRLGMEPVTQPMPGCGTDTVINVRAGDKNSASAVKPTSPPSPTQQVPSSAPTQTSTSSSVPTATSGGATSQQTASGPQTPKTCSLDALSMATATSLSSGILNGSGPPGSVAAAAAAAAVAAAPASMYRPNFSQAFQRAAAYASPGLFSLPCGLANGPADLSMKSKPLLSHKLNPAEMTAVRQLVTGYRESAAFLMRSADELEQLLRNQ